MERHRHRETDRNKQRNSDRDRQTDRQRIEHSTHSWDVALESIVDIIAEVLDNRVAVRRKVSKIYNIITLIVTTSCLCMYPQTDRYAYIQTYIHTHEHTNIQAC